MLFFLIASCPLRSLAKLLEPSSHMLYVLYLFTFNKAPQVVTTGASSLNFTQAHLTQALTAFQPHLPLYQLNLITHVAELIQVLHFLPNLIDLSRKWQVKLQSLEEHHKWREEQKMSQGELS